MTEPSHRIAQPASLLADPTRAAIVLALMDGRSRPAKKLALDAGVTPQTASAHLKKLVAARMLAWESRGRFKHFRLAGAEVADAVEALCQLGPDAMPGRVLTAAAREIRFARCCYDHLAGQLGVAVTERLPACGPQIFAALDIDLAALETLRRPLSRCCTDWTEQRPHLGGALGAALLAAYKEKRWLLPVEDSRKLEVTLQGRSAFVERFGVDERLFTSQPRATPSTSRGTPSPRRDSRARTAPA
jgi:DNA-binding transcriptional ArsR family regulator